MHNLEQLQNDAKNEILKCKDIRALEALRVDYLGKKGKLTEVLKSLGQLSKEERPRLGQAINEVKTLISTQLEDKLAELKHLELLEKLKEETLDISLPGRSNFVGSIHPVTQVKNRINEYFTSLGFDVVSGLEIENEFYNFEALNIPESHPARQMHDTFYFNPDSLLRTHTSPVQIRAMEKQKPPFRIIAPGKVYRCDSDMTHTPMFHQVEGLMIDKDVNMAGLKWILEDFFKFFFHSQKKLRFRPSYFPFTEPSAEVDIECTSCHGDGCRSCKFTGWLEVLGCGMVHPNVLKAVNIDSNEFQGWAFGMGIDRLAMLYFGIDDLRKMFENDLNFLNQF